jgi:hypothetical protein
MEQEKEENARLGPGVYPVWFSVLIVLFALIGGGIFLLFGFFFLVTLSSPSGGLSILGLIAAVAEGWSLYKIVRFYFSGTQPMSVIFYWAALAVVGIPFLAFWGCALMSDSLRIAG